jgi:hypothetical protein
MVVSRIGYHHMWGLDDLDTFRGSLTQKRALVRVQLRPQLEPLDDLEGFLGSLRFEHWGKLIQLRIEMGLLI